MYYNKFLNSELPTHFSFYRNFCFYHYFKQEDNVPTEKRLRSAIRAVLPNHKLYDLRTTFYTRCTECGVAEPAKKEFVGHSLGKLGNAYTDLSDEYLLTEGAKLLY